MRVLVTGGGGFLGRHVVAALLPNRGYALCVNRTTRQFDLRGQEDVRQLFRATSPAVVIHLACPTPGGIGAMAQHPTLCADMARVDANVVETCADFGVSQLITVGSVCSFPEHAPLPATELDLWSGEPERTNAPYGEAKRFLWTLLEAFRQERGLQSTYLILTNVYGPGDRSGHLIPSTIRKIREAQRDGAEEIVAWGDGTATRDLVYVDDVVRGIVAAVDQPPCTQPILLCSGEEIPVVAVVHGLVDLCGWSGDVRWDVRQPVGQHRRVFRSLGAAWLGWAPQVGFLEGLARTVRWWAE